MSLDRCLHYYASISQRVTELGYGIGIEGTSGFEKQGCYDCDGKDLKCKGYTLSSLLSETIYLNNCESHYYKLLKSIFDGKLITPRTKEQLSEALYISNNY